MDEPLLGEDLLTAMVGEWEGTYRVWLEPGVLRSDSPSRATIVPMLHGRYVAQDYEWADQGALQQGTMLLGSDGDGVWHLAWVDTFHTGLSIMLCRGEAGDAAEVLGTYGGAGEWGWRTTWTMFSGPAPEDAGPAGSDLDHLVVTAWNITPEGEEAKATEATYERRA
jgi:Protein of unknown function (DUF1579)